MSNKKISKIWLVVLFTVLVLGIVVMTMLIYRQNPVLRVRFKLAVSGLTSDVKAPTILLLGDSRVEQWNKQCFSRDSMETLNLGVSNSTSVFWVNLAEQYIEDFPFMSDLVVWLGINDLKNIHAMPEQVADNINKLLMLLAKKTDRIILLGQIPVKVYPDRWNDELNANIKKLNIMLKELSDLNKKVVYLRIYDEFNSNKFHGKDSFYNDGIHLNVVGDKYICEILRMEIGNGQP